MSMVDVLFPALYFVIISGVFRQFLFKNGITFWHKPLLVLLYHAVAVMVAVVLFGGIPAELFTKGYELAALSLTLIVGLMCLLAWRGYFSWSGNRSSTLAEDRGHSFKYIVGGSAERIFQDILSVVVILSLFEFFRDPLLTAIYFASFFFAIHLILAFIWPIRFVLIFAIPSFFAGVAFAYIVINGLNIIYIFVLHSLFYIIMYPVIQRVFRELTSVGTSNKITKAPN